MDQAVAILHPVQDLTIIPTDIRLSVFTTPNAIEPWLDHVRKSVADFKPDTSTARGRANIKSIAFEVTKSKTYLTKVGKELADEQKAIPKLIDATRKHITETLEALAVSVRQPLTDWEQEEEQRVQAHRNAIGNFAALSEGGQSLSLVHLKENLALIEAMLVDAEHCEEFLSEYVRARDASVLILKTLIPIREKAEADTAELIQLRADKAARDERDAFEADLLEKAAVEKAAAERAAAWKIESERLAAEAAAQLVRDTEARVVRESNAAKAKEAEEELRRQNDINNRTAVNKAAAAAFIGHGLDEEQAKKIVRLIVGNLIPHVTINY